MDLTDRYISYISGVRRYSGRTVELYRSSLEQFITYLDGEDLVLSLNPSIIRSYEVYLLEDKKMSAHTVGLHISILSSFCKYLFKEGLLQNNPVRTVGRPKAARKLPAFYRDESMKSYFNSTSLYAREECLGLVSGKDAAIYYDKILHRLIISILFQTGIRRSELIGLRSPDLDLRREVLTVHGKGDKTREIPVERCLTDEILLYLKAKALLGLESGTLLCTSKGAALYPVYVDRAVKSELGTESSITSRKSPHVLRHTIATELLNEGAGLNSIKEMLGHSSLAATQVYTHNSIEKLKKAYNQSHPLCQSSKKQ